MEEEIQYVNVTFKSKPISPNETQDSMEIIYDEVKTEEMAQHAHLITESRKKAPLCIPLSLLAAGLGISCVALVLVIVFLSTYFAYEHRRQNSTLVAQNLQLWAEKASLQRRMEELTRERGRLNWTLGVILEYDNFPVKEHCPQKVCKPCLDNWVLFQSNCYLFRKQKYSWRWKTWEGSLTSCRETKADLVVIDSRREQEFINNHTEVYNDEKHGYWIGLRKKNAEQTWKWVDGSNVTVMFWTSQKPDPWELCALSKPAQRSLANWVKVSCSMRNRWICETRALIRPD
ncbi:C-type lectin domain family 4 member M-like [Cololabis saira]|uniref:C-type lectin domain family 4 member M-like n=1 Tax=Cololabis saira TaxID=129043 RepID=UPI002AD469B8|nr:C-type lectin domain family 4 member M-like [Cololabis saira]